MQTIKPDIEAAIKERTDCYRNVTKRREAEERWSRLMDDNQKLIDREEMALRGMVYLALAGCVVAAFMALSGCRNA
jgi:hypothetical protein